MKVEEAVATPAQTEPLQVGIRRAMPCRLPVMGFIIAVPALCVWRLSVHDAQEEATAEGDEVCGRSSQQENACNKTVNEQLSADLRIRPLAHAWLDTFVFEEVKTLAPGGALSGNILKFSCFSGCQALDVFEAACHALPCCRLCCLWRLTIADVRLMHMRMCMLTMAPC